MNQPHSIDEADAALRYVLKANGATFWESEFGNIIIHKPKPGRGSPYDKIVVPKEMLAVIRHRIENGEPQQDFEGILEPPKRGPRRAGRPVRR